MSSKKGLGLVLGLLISATLAWGQIPHSQVVFAYIGLSADPVSLSKQLRDADIQLLDNRLRGYLLEIARQENYSIVTPRNSSQLMAFLNNSQSDRFHDEPGNPRFAPVI